MRVIKGLYKGNIVRGNVRVISVLPFICSRICHGLSGRARPNYYDALVAGGFRANRTCITGILLALLTF